MFGPENSFHGAPGKCFMTIWVKCEMSRDRCTSTKQIKQGLVCFILQAHISLIYPRTKTKTCISFRQPNLPTSRELSISSRLLQSSASPHHFLSLLLTLSPTQNRSAFSAPCEPSVSSILIHRTILRSYKSHM